MSKTDLAPHSPIDRIAATLEEADRRGLRRTLKNISARSGPLVTFQGKELVNFASNDYLGLAQHPHLESTFTQALTDLGLGSASSRLVSGTFAPHAELEHRFASFKGTESSLFFPSGYQANISAVTSLADDRTIIYSDERNHASIVDACRLTRSTRRIYRHLDIDHLSKLLDHDSHLPNRTRIMVSDTVFSTDGALAPLADLSFLANRHGALWLVDEAHATGVMGPKGRGLAAHYGLHPDLQVATFSKAFGLSGGVVATSRLLRDALINFGRSFIYTTAPLPALAATALAATDIISSRQGEELRQRLFSNVDLLTSGLRSGGWDIGTQSHIVAVVLDHPKLATAASSWLSTRGLLALPLRPPTVPPGNSLLRISPTAIHTQAQIAHCVEALCELRTQLPRMRSNIEKKQTP